MKMTKKTTSATPPFSNTTPISKMGFTDLELKVLSPRARKLTRSELVSLVEKPGTAPAALALTFKDLQGLHSVAVNALKKPTTGGGGSGDGGIRCCCCIACCCCCCAVSVPQPKPVD